MKKPTVRYIVAVSSAVTDMVIQTDNSARGWQKGVCVHLPTTTTAPNGTRQVVCAEQNINQKERD